MNMNEEVKSRPNISNDQDMESSDSKRQRTTQRDTPPIQMGGVSAPQQFNESEIRVEIPVLQQGNLNETHQQVVYQSSPPPPPPPPQEHHQQQQQQQPQQHEGGRGQVLQQVPNLAMLVPVNGGPVQLTSQAMPPLPPPLPPPPPPPPPPPVANNTEVMTNQNIMVNAPISVGSGSGVMSGNVPVEMSVMNITLRNSSSSTSSSSDVNSMLTNAADVEEIGFSSKYHGVSKHKNGKQWRVQIRAKQISLYFKTELEAAHKYDQLVREHNLEKSPLNFPTEKEIEEGRSSLKKRRSKYRGVNIHKRSNKWRATVFINGVMKHIGYFATEIEAAKAYDKKVMEINVDNRELNFPEDYPGYNYIRGVTKRKRAPKPPKPTPEEAATADVAAAAAGSTTPVEGGEGGTTTSEEVVAKSGTLQESGKNETVNAPLPSQDNDVSALSTSSTVTTMKPPPIPQSVQGDGNTSSQTIQVNTQANLQDSLQDNLPQPHLPMEQAYQPLPPPLPQHMTPRPPDMNHESVYQAV